MAGEVSAASGQARARHRDRPGAVSGLRNRRTVLQPYRTVTSRTPREDMARRWPGISRGESMIGPGAHGRRLPFLSRYGAAWRASPLPGLPGGRRISSPVPGGRLVSTSLAISSSQKRRRGTGRKFDALPGDAMSIGDAGPAVAMDRRRECLAAARDRVRWATTPRRGTAVAVRLHTPDLTGRRGPPPAIIRAPR